MMPLTMMHGKPRCSPGYEWMQLAIYGKSKIGQRKQIKFACGAVEATG